MNNTTAIVAVSLGSLVAVVVVSVLRPDSDNTILIGLIFAAAVPTITGLLSFIKSAQNSADLAMAQDKLNAANAAIAKTDTKVQNLAITVDGRLSQLLEARTEAAHSTGVRQGEQDERERAAAAQSPPAPGETPARGTPTQEMPPRS